MCDRAKNQEKRCYRARNLASRRVDFEGGRRSMRSPPSGGPAYLPNLPRGGGEPGRGRRSRRCRGCRMAIRAGHGDRGGGSDGVRRAAAEPGERRRRRHRARGGGGHHGARTALGAICQITHVLQINRLIYRARIMISPADGCRL